VELRKFFPPKGKCFTLPMSNSSREYFDDERENAQAGLATGSVDTRLKQSKTQNK
jgi:hypothetical protein